MVFAIPVSLGGIPVSIQEIIHKLISFDIQFQIDVLLLHASQNEILKKILQTWTTFYIFCLPIVFYLHFIRHTYHKDNCTFAFFIVFKKMTKLEKLV